MVRFLNISSRNVNFKNYFITCRFPQIQYLSNIILNLCYDIFIYCMQIIINVNVKIHQNYMQQFVMNVMIHNKFLFTKNRQAYKNIDDLQSPISGFLCNISVTLATCYNIGFSSLYLQHFQQQIGCHCCLHIDPMDTVKNSY